MARPIKHRTEAERRAATKKYEEKRRKTMSEETRLRRYAQMCMWKKKNKEEVNRRQQLRRRTRTEEQKLVERLGHVRRKFGLNKQQYLDLVETQNNSCAVCGNVFTKDKWPCVDHCHKTHTVRALLCFSCNVGLGAVKESIVILTTMIEYLKKHDTNTKSISG